MNSPDESTPHDPHAASENSDWERNAAETFQEEWLSAYLDEELDSHQQQLVERRLASDPRAVQLLDELRRVRGLVGRLPSWSGHVAPVPVFERDDLFGQETGLAGEESDDIGTSQALTDAAEFEYAQLAASAATVEPAGVYSRSLTADSSGLRRDRQWWRLLGLAACLVLSLGAGLWWLLPDSPLSVATNTPAAKREMAGEAREMMPEQTNVAASADRALGLPQEDFTQQPSEFEALAENQPAAELRVESDVDLNAAPAAPGASGGAAYELRLASPPTIAATPESPATLAIPADALADGAAANVPAPLSTADDSDQYYSDLTWLENGQIQLELARSEGWSEEEVRLALPRLAPYLNVQRKSELDRLANPTVAAIPLALLAQKPQGWSSAELMANVQQPTVQLQQVLPATAAANQADPLTRRQSDAPAGRLRSAPLESTALGSAAPQPPASQSPASQSPASQSPALKSTEPPDALAAATDQAATVPSSTITTVALFVLREEAERIVQAAQAADQLVSKPVWILASDELQQSASPEQKVVLLFSPQ
jgi:hypothetical protein